MIWWQRIGPLKRWQSRLSLFNQEYTFLFPVQFLCYPFWSHMNDKNTKFRMRNMKIGVMKSIPTSSVCDRRSINLFFLNKSFFPQLYDLTSVLKLYFSLCYDHLKLLIYILFIWLSVLKCDECYGLLFFWCVCVSVCFLGEKTSATEKLTMCYFFEVCFIIIPIVDLKCIQLNAVFQVDVKKITILDICFSKQAWNDTMFKQPRCDIILLCQLRFPNFFYSVVWFCSCFFPCNKEKCFCTLFFTVVPYLGCNFCGLWIG